jgi:hypothetical protein
MESVRDNPITLAKSANAVGKTHAAARVPQSKVLEIKSYSELLEQTKKYIEEIIALFDAIKGITYDRVGIVATANLDENSVPPGLNTWLNYLGKPWDHELHETDITLWATLRKEKDYFERCAHNVEFKREKIPQTGYRFTMDWQRMYDIPPTLNSKKTHTILDNCIKSAIEYFEKFGEGDLNYG